MASSKEFKHAIGVLKKQGLINPAIDLRKAKPNTKSGGRRLDTLVEKFDDVVTGKLQAVKVPAKDLRTLRAQGFEAAAGRVLVPKTKSEVAKFTRGEIQVNAITGQQRVVLPIEFHNAEQYLRDIRKNRALIDRMKRGNEYFGIRYKGGQRANFYSSIDQLLDVLQKYDFNGGQDQEEIFANLEVMRITPREALKIEKRIAERKKPTSQAYQRKHAKKQYGKTKRIYTRNERLKARAADWQKEYRASLTGKALAKYRANARKRAKKSRERMKKKHAKSKRNKSRR